VQHSPTPLTSEEQKKVIEKKLAERAKLTLSLQNSPDNPNYQRNREIALAACMENPVDGFLFWCDTFAWIQDPEADNPQDKNIPFLLYDFQEFAAAEIIQAIEEGRDIPIEKSRKMGMSWLSVTVFIYLWAFYRYDFLCGSQTKAKVDRKGDMDSLFEKVRFIISKLPHWMVPPLKDKEHDKNLLIIHPQHKATIAGESNNTNFGRAGRRRAILFDEFSSWEQTDKAAWQSCASTTKCRVALSTPNTRGTNCHYYTVMQNAKDKQLPYLRLHWTLHPYFAEGLYTTTTSVSHVVHGTTSSVSVPHLY
jgi:hypothetical protein